MLLSNAQKSPDRSQGSNLLLKLTLLETAGAYVLHRVGRYFCMTAIALGLRAKDRILQHLCLTKMEAIDALNILKAKWFHILKLEMN